MKNSFLLFVMMTAGVQVFSQSGNGFAADADKVYGLAKEAASKQGYRFLIKFAATNQAAINVTRNTSYIIFFVYDNTYNPLPNFNAHLMTPDSALMKKHTVKSVDRTQVGVARVSQLEFSTGSFTGDTKPVKLDAKPAAFIYVFYKKLSSN
jgi:hypothetical protein